MKKCLFVFLTIWGMSLFALSSYGQYKHYSFVTKDKDKISNFKRILKSAAKGNMFDNYKLGKLYLDGSIIAKDTVSGIECLEYSGSKNYSLAILFLADYYYERYLDSNKTVFQDKAIKWNLKLEKNYLNNNYMLSYNVIPENDYFEALGRLSVLYVSKDDKVNGFSYLKKTVCHPNNINDYLNEGLYETLANCYRLGLGTKVDNRLADYWTAIAAIAESTECMKYLENKYSNENERYVFWNAVRKEFKNLLLTDSSNQSRFLYDWLLSLSEQEESSQTIDKLLEQVTKSKHTEMECYVVYLSLREYYRNNNASEQELSYVESQISKYRPNPMPRYKMNSWIISILVNLINKNN